MGIIQVQTDFTHGELSPVMRGRYDVTIYRKAAERLTNMLILPQGPATRRFGFEFNTDLEVIPNEYQLFEFSSVEGDRFLLLLINNELRIFLETGIEHPSSPLVFPFAGSLLINSEIKYSQTHDEALFVHPTVQPQALRFNPTTNLFSTQKFTFKTAPTFDFQDVNYENSVFRLDTIGVGLETSLFSNPAIFDSEHVGGAFVYAGPEAASPLGYATITSFVSTEEVRVIIINEFADQITTIFGVKGSAALLEKLALSDVRGWPRSVSFYESRLVFGGSKSLPQTVMMSQIDDYRDFTAAGGQADNAIIATISSNESSAINDIISDRSLQIFTESGEYSPPQLEENALTPTTISIRKQSSIGSDKRVAPVTIDNNTFYSQKGGRAILAFVYQNSTASYESVPSSTVSNHLIANVIDMTTLKGRTDSDANFLFLVNADPVERVDETLAAGTMAAFQTVASQSVAAWTPIVTKNGKFKRTQAVGSTLFVIVERIIEGIPVQYLEKSNFDKLTDSSLSFSFSEAVNVVNGLEHLDGETVDVIADGFVLTPKPVINGAITVTKAAKVFEIGLRITTELRTMPISVEGDSGPLLPTHQRFPRYFIDLLKSQGVEVNGILIRNLLFSEKFIEGPLPLRTDLFEIVNLDGWDPRQAITLTQNGPFPMTVLGIGYEVDL